MSRVSLEGRWTQSIGGYQLGCCEEPALFLKIAIGLGKQAHAVLQRLRKEDCLFLDQPGVHGKAWFHKENGVVG